MPSPRNLSEAGFDEVRIVEKDIVEPRINRIRSSLLKFDTGTDGLLVVTLAAMLVAAVVIERLYPGFSQYLSTLQGALNWGR